MFLNSTQRDFDKMAEEVVSSLLEGKTPLKESIVKQANAKGLNPEEVKRLVEKSNTLATIQLIKSASDGSLEFNMASFEDVAKETHPEGLPIEKEAQHSTPSQVPKTMLNTVKAKVDLSSFFKPHQVKIASEPINTRKIFQLKREIETLGRKKVAAELSFKKSADALVSEFSNLYSPDFSKFANESYTLLGDTALPLLEALAKDIRQPETFTKVAYIIDDIDNKPLDMMKKAHSAITEVCSLITTICTKKAEMAMAWADVKSARVV